MRILALLFTVSPEEITAWAETILVYLLAIASAVITLATTALRFLNFATPVIERWYSREGAGDWRPKFWSVWDTLTWTIQRVSGAGHLPSQTEMFQHSGPFKEKIPND